MLRFQPFSLRVAAFFALGRVAFRQILSEPVVVLLVLFAHMASLLAPLFQFQRFGEEGRLAREGALAAMLIAGLPLAFFAVAGTMGKEQRSGLAAMLFSKPVDSLDFCLSKVFAAVTAVVWWGWNQGGILLLSTASAPREVLASSGETLYTINRVAFLCGLAGIVLPLVAAALSNRWREKDFCLTFSLLLPLTLTLGIGVAYWVGCPIEWRLIPAALPIVSLLIGAVSWTVLVCSFLSGGVALCLFSVWLIMALLCGAIFPTAITNWLDLVLPDLSFCWLAEFLANGGQIPYSYWLWPSATLLAQAGLYTLAAVVVCRIKEPATHWGDA